jgi:O-antigen/teichoic acid export membrane protein
MDDGGVRAIVTGSRKENVGALMVKIFRYALPICMGSLILPLFSLIDTFTVKNVLQWIGVPFHQAKWWFGIYTRGQPLVQFASFFATALSLALVPAIAESVTKRNAAYTRSAVAFALRLTLVIGLPASVGLALIAQPLNIMLYQDDKGTSALMILSFAPVFSTLCITSSGILQGLGRLYLPVGHLLIGVLVKLLLNLLLTSRWSIEGAALATVIGYLAAAALNLLAVKRSAGLTLDLNRFIVKPLLATLFMAAVVLLTIRLAGLAGNGGGTRAGCSLTALGAVLVGAAAYLMAVFRNRILTEDDFKWLPDGERFLSIARRFCLLPRKRES